MWKGLKAWSCSHPCQAEVGRPCREVVGHPCQVVAVNREDRNEEVSQEAGEHRAGVLLCLPCQVEAVGTPCGQAFSKVQSDF